MSYAKTGRIVFYPAGPVLSAREEPITRQRAAYLIRAARSRGAEIIRNAGLTVVYDCSKETVTILEIPAP